MKPAPFSYVRAFNLEEALDLLEEYGADSRILAGGQSLLPTLNLRLSAPSLLIDINRIESLRGISIVGNEIQIGALTKHVEVASNPIIASKLALLYEAMPHVAHAAIRNRGTLGGSLALADPAAELPACMLALDAKLLIASKRGERKIAARDFFKGLYTTALGPTEILKRIDIPHPAPDSRFYFNEFSRRHGDYALVGIAAACSFVEGGPIELKLVYFGCGDRPLRATHLEAAIKRSGLESPNLESAIAEAIRFDLDPQSDLHASSATRLHLATVLARRAINHFVRVTPGMYAS